jgi:hypothetical protein
MSAQTAGVVGIVVCLALIVGVILLRGWAIDRVDGIAGKVDAGIAKGVPLIDAASTRVTEVSARVGLVANAAAARAADPGPAPVLVQTLQSAIASASDRYLALRAGYADARETVVSALDRLNTIDRLVPAISIPEGPVDALAALDARARELDASVMEIIDADPGIGSGQAAAAIADKASQVEAKLQQVTTALTEAKTRLTDLRAEVQAKADQVKNLITLGTLVAILVLVYSILLHWVLFRSGRQMRRDGDAG